MMLLCVKKREASSRAPESAGQKEGCWSWDSEIASNGRQENSFSELPWSGQKLFRNHQPRQQLAEEESEEKGSGGFGGEEMEERVDECGGTRTFFFFLSAGLLLSRTAALFPAAASAGNRTR
jgi:hypothetical protein